MIASLGPIGVAILVVGALLTLACLFRRPAPAAEPRRAEPESPVAPEPRPMTGPAPAPESREVEPHETRPYANGAISIGESGTPAISVRDLKERAK